MIQLIRGFRDILPGESERWQAIEDTARAVLSDFGFREIRIPILEATELFTRSIGENTDIVEKEMYTFEDRKGDFVTLRPEATASIVRSYIQHKLYAGDPFHKLFTTGPMFRRERPQKGRYRQFYQISIESLGSESWIIDAQIIQIFYNILQELKLKNLIVQINSIGDSQCRPYYKKLLVSYFKSREQSLCVDCRRRLRENPLRVLDCKEEKCQRIVSQAPQLIDHLCESCHRHFKGVLEFLDEIELPYQLNPYLVRGLDYYTKTVFEIFGENATKTEGEEPSVGNALVAGGRYDNLIKLLGGEDTKATGAAMGMERVIAALKLKGIKSSKSATSPIFLAQLGNLAKRKSLKLLEDFRKAKIQVAESFGRDSLKAQLKMADRVEAQYALILGQQEALDGTIIIRDMKTGKQETVKLEKTVKEMQRRLKK